MRTLKKRLTADSRKEFCSEITSTFRDSSISCQGREGSYCSPRCAMSFDSKTGCNKRGKPAESAQQAAHAGLAPLKQRREARF